MLKVNTLNALLLCAIGALGCGGDDSAEPEDNGGAAPTGRTDAGNTPASGSDAGRTFVPSAGALACGTAKCANPTTAAIPGFPTPAVCCADAASNQCGLTNLQTNQCEAPPKLDERCPAVSGMGIDLKPCCTKAETCGIDASQFGGGCNDLADPMLRMFNPNAPAPRRCDGAPLPAAATAPDASTPAAP
jgi:hypothetical protein